MMQLLLFSTLIISFFVYYVLFIKPKKEILRYKQTIQKLGYKVKVYPYILFGSSLFSSLQEDIEKHGDKLYSFKHQNQCYDLAIHNIFTKVFIDIYNVDLMKEFLGPQSPRLYHKIDYLIINIKRSLGRGMGLCQGEEWKKKRKIIHSVFNYELLQAMIPKIVRICNQNFEMDHKIFETQQINGKTIVKFKIFKLFAGIFSNVVMQCFFSIPSTFQMVQGQLISTFQNQLQRDIGIQSTQPISLLLGQTYLNMGLTAKDRDINRRIKILRAICIEKINKRLAQIQKEGARQNYSDIIEALVYTNQFKFKKQANQIDKFDYQQLIYEFGGFLTAGTETSSHLTQMMIHYLIQNPDCQNKLRKEINEFIKSDQDITSQNLKKMKYIGWVQNETTRMYGPANGILFREATQDHMLLNIPIKRGTGLNYNPMVNHYSQNYYQEPFKFKPQRWEKGLQQKNPFALCGFSGGPRTCLGRHLALLESKIALIKFLKSYQQLELSKKNYKMIQPFIYQPQQIFIHASKIK